MTEFIFGKLTLSAFPHDPVAVVGASLIVVGWVTIVSILTYLGRWKWLWTEWLTSLDHKKIGVMYLIVAFVMLFRGFIDALMMRTHLVFSVGELQGYLAPDHYDQIFTAHGVIMIFFVAMPLMFGLINLVVPLQIGARDVAFPFLNNLSFWLFAGAALLMNASLILGEFAMTGWLAYPPLSELQFSPTVGVDYYLWVLQLSGAGTLISGINFLVTILKMRAPGMTLFRMPMFSWTVLSSMALVIASFPILTATLGLLILDRYLGMHFFTTDLGGNAMLYINLIWAWGHPEVYILILPAFGIFSEVVQTFSQKRLFGYVTMVWATIAITVLSFIVWVHHFYTMGAGANVNAFFGIMTMIIAVPTGVKVFNWLFTMFRGRIILATPMLWTIGFLVTFTLGGMTGVILSIPGVDFQLHNSLFLIAHFHNTIIGGVVFGYFAGLAYWFPKISGFTLNEKIGKAAFWCWIIGFFVAFVPLYVLGLMGMTRRVSHYDAGYGWWPLLVVAAIGAGIILIGILLQVAQFIISIREGKKHLDKTGDPWNGWTLEWMTSSPPAVYNFAHIPVVHSRQPFWDIKYGEGKYDMPPYEDIEVPKRTPLGFLIGAFAYLMCFGLVWHIVWLVPLSVVGMIAGILIHSFTYETEYRISAEEVRAIEQARLKHAS